MYSATAKGLLSLAEQRLFNTGLFITTSIKISPVDSIYSDLIVTVKERFYTYPNLIFELADRNFNEWWTLHHHNLRRTNYGFVISQKNVRGRNETLKLRLQGGLVRKAELFYNFPYIHKKQRAGLGLALSFISTPSVAYTLSRNKLVNTHGDHWLENRFYTGLKGVYRNKYYSWHYLNILFNMRTIANDVQELNNNYLGKNKTKIRYLTLGYTFSRDKRDFQYYPLKGNYFKTELQKNGIGLLGSLNTFSARFEYARYFDLGKNFFFASGATGLFSVPLNQPFFLLPAMGFGNDVVRGYELYVVKGQAYGILKNSLKYRFLQHTFHINWLPVKQFMTIPFAIYLTANADAGYVWDKYHMPENALFANRLLPGGGMGLDFVTFYDVVIRTEYSINSRGECGFYLSFAAAIGGKR